nr:hypothetical protein [Brevundimonas naejangsanensis]
MTAPEVLEGGRRLNVVTGAKSYIGLSVPAWVSDERALAETLRVLERVEWGRARRIVSIDGGSGATWAVKVAMAYAEMWLTIAFRATFGRRATKRRIDGIRASFASQAARQSRGGEG